ncbi:MAG: MFS transporter [Candidatus Micrarchaeota archaeon]|nr:MFS transporter [Candidatus Micrarchaeota archaeon]
MAEKRNVLGNIPKVYITSFLLGLTFFGAIVVPFFLDWGKLDYAAIFTLEAAFSITIVLSEVPTGVFADKYGRKNSILVGIFLQTMGILLFLALGADFWVFFATEIIWGISAAFISGADRALVFDSLVEAGQEKRAKKVFANMKIADTAGIVIAAPAGSWVAANMGSYPGSLTLPFFMTVAAFGLAFLACLTMVEPKREKPQKGGFALAMAGFDELRRNKRLQSLSFDYVSMSAAAFFVFWFYQSVLRANYVDLSLYGIFSAAFNIISMLVLAKLARLEKWLGTSQLLFLSALAIALAYLGLAANISLWFAMLAVTIAVCARTIRQPVFEHYLNFQIKSSERATVLSAISASERVVVAVLYPIVGFVADVSLQGAFLVLGAITLFFALKLRTDEKAFEK